MNALKTLCRLLEESGAKVTFSINCHSGIVSVLGPDAKCGCWRCRESRGEPWDDATEEDARVLSLVAQKEFRKMSTRVVAR